MSLEGMNLYEDSLEEYEELESSFLQGLRDRTLSWFGPLVSPSTQRDSAPLLSVDKKPYRDMILANSISIFDFRIYLLARQCLLLSKMGDVIDICKKVAAFLNAFGRRLRESEVGSLRGGVTFVLTEIRIRIYHFSLSSVGFTPLH